MARVDKVKGKQKMRESAISVIIPVYNVGNLLCRCINSILCQTMSPYEIILVDDGSTDCSSQICDEYASNYSNICVIHQHNKGVSAARNIGVKQATGDYVAFVDADDYLHPKYFEILFNGLKTDKAEVSCCKWTWGDCENPQSFPEAIPSYEEMSAEEAFASGKIEKAPYCKIIKRDAIGKVEFDVNLALLEDSIHTKTLLLNGLIKKVIFTPLALYYYYQRPDSASHTKPAAERMPALECSYAKIGTYQDEVKNYLWIESTIKLLCSTREAARKEKDKETVSLCNEMAGKLVSLILKNKTASTLKRVTLGVFCKSTTVYRLLMNGNSHLKKLMFRLKG